MAGRFVNPFPQFLDATPTVRSGAKLFFYAAGTATKQNTYSDKALSSANTNPVVLNSAGYSSTDIYLQDLDYKVVLAPSTDSDPPTSPIWSADYVRGRDSALIAKTLTGAGSPTGTVAGTAGSASILPDFYWDYTNSILYVCTTTGTASTAVWTAVNASTAAAVVPMPQGYLTLTTATPIITADVTAAAAVYYTPYQGNIVPIYNGASFNPTVFTELTLTLNASHVASNIYDVFVFSNSGVVTVVTGPSWSAGTAGSITAGSCARGTGAGGAALTRVSGILTNAAQITGRNGATTYTIAANLATYVGSIFMDGTNGQISCHRTYGQSRKWGVWNAYNRNQIILKAGDATASWAVAGAGSVRAQNGSSANSLTTFTGLSEEMILYQIEQTAQLTANQATAATTGFVRSGIGYNATNAFSGKVGELLQTWGNIPASVTLLIKSDLVGEYVPAPAIGINVVTACEQLQNALTQTLYGAESSNILSAAWRG